MRIAQQPSERIDRSQEISFRFDGRSVVAHPGDTIASALLASGQRVFSRSFKYHRPRGETCGAGRCAGSLVEVDGWPGIRACSEPAREGAEVRHLNAWPSLRFDLMRSVDLFGGRLTPPGFYYKTFIRPRRLQPLYQRLLRKAAGLGRLEREQAERCAAAVLKHLQAQPGVRRSWFDLQDVVRWTIRDWPSARHSRS